MGNKQGIEIIKKSLMKNGQVSDEELREIFRLFDTSKDGSLQRSEAAILIKDTLLLMSEQFPSKKSKWLSKDYQLQVLDDMDQNNDNEISYDEFKEWFQSILDFGNPELETRESRKLLKKKDDEGNKIINDYAILSLLGKGSYGKVFMCMQQSNNKIVAVKSMKKSILSNVKMDNYRTALDALYDEVKVMKILKHPNIIKLYEVIDDPDAAKIHLVLEYAEKGISFDVKAGKPLLESEAKRYFMDLIFSVEYLHKKGVIHRDIKPENMLLDGKGVLKLADFGTSRFFYCGFDKTKLNAGTPAFASPESCQDELHSGIMSDIWACGVSLYSFLFGCLPFEKGSLQEIYKSILFDEPDYNRKVEQPLTAESIDLLKCILDKNPDTRYTINEIKKHPWFNDVAKEWYRYDHDKRVAAFHNENWKPVGKTKSLPSGGNLAGLRSMKSFFASASTEGDFESPMMIKKKRNQSGVGEFSNRK